MKPKNTVEVAVALKIITSVGSKFAVRNGGHNPNPGWGSIGNSGVLIDTSGIDTLKLSDDHKVLHAGTGHKWIDVQPVVDRYGISVVGGVNLDVGISGVLLGGMSLLHEICNVI